MMEFGEHGDWAPETIFNIPYPLYNAIIARLSTIRGRQILRPPYGSFVHREVHHHDYPAIIRSVTQAITGLNGIVGIRLTTEGEIVSIIVQTESGSVQVVV